VQQDCIDNRTVLKRGGHDHGRRYIYSVTKRRRGWYAIKRICKVEVFMTSTINNGDKRNPVVVSEYHCTGLSPSYADVTPLCAQTGQDGSKLRFRRVAGQGEICLSTLREIRS